MPESIADQIERDRLIVECLPLVRLVAARVTGSLPVQVDVDDLVHTGIMALFNAALKYHAGMHASFQTYAKQRIKGAILESLCRTCGDVADDWKRLRAIWLLSWNTGAPGRHSRNKWAWVPRDDHGLTIELRRLGPQSSIELVGSPELVES